MTRPASPPTPARDAAPEAYMARYPDVPYKQADLTVARLICCAIEDGLVCGDVRLWRRGDEN